MSLAEATAAYQASLEHYRAAVEDDAPLDVQEQLEADLAKAKKEMEVAWLESKLL